MNTLHHIFLPKLSNLFIQVIQSFGIQKVHFIKIPSFCLKEMCKSTNLWWTLVGINNICWCWYYTYLLMRSRAWSLTNNMFNNLWWCSWKDHVSWGISLKNYINKKKFMKWNNISVFIKLRECNKHLYNTYCNWLLIMKRVYMWRFPTSSPFLLPRLSSHAVIFA